MISGDNGLNEGPVGSSDQVDLHRLVSPPSIADLEGDSVLLLEAIGFESPRSRVVNEDGAWIAIHLDESEPFVLVVMPYPPSESGVWPRARRWHESSIPPAISRAFLPLFRLAHLSSLVLTRPFDEGLPHRFLGEHIMFIMKCKGGVGL